MRPRLGCRIRWFSRGGDAKAFLLINCTGIGPFARLPIFDRRNSPQRQYRITACQQYSWQRPRVRRPGPPPAKSSWDFAVCRSEGLGAGRPRPSNGDAFLPHPSRKTFFPRRQESRSRKSAYSSLTGHETQAERPGTVIDTEACCPGLPVLLRRKTHSLYSP